MSSTTTLSAAAADRKARLAQLKNLKRKQPESTVDAPSEHTTDTDSRPTKSPRTESAQPTAEAAEEDDISAAVLSGRNYDPLTKAPKLGFELNPSLAAGSATVEKRAQVLSDEVKAQLEAERAEAAAQEAVEEQEQQQQQQLDLFKLRPKKPNWDLKRRLDERMRVVDVRTENAIARLVRERIEGKRKEGERAAATSAAAGTDDGHEEGTGELGIEGSALVEATKEREREAEDDARREREADAELEAA